MERTYGNSILAIGNPKVTSLPILFSRGPLTNVNGFIRKLIPIATLFRLSS